MSFNNTNQGRIWPNDRKKNDTHPDFRGSINIEGKEYSISAWKQHGGARPGNLSLSFSGETKNATRIEPAKDYCCESG